MIRIIFIMCLKALYLDNDNFQFMQVADDEILISSEKIYKIIKFKPIESEKLYFRNIHSITWCGDKDKVNQIKVTYSELDFKDEPKPRFCSVDLGLSALITLVNNQNNPPLILKNPNQANNEELLLSSIKKYLGQYKEKIKKQNYQYAILGKILYNAGDLWKIYNYFIRVWLEFFPEIKLIIAEEEFTSKSSFLDGEPLRVDYNYDLERTNPKTRTIKSNLGIELDRDINGALNIGRKVFPDGFDDCTAVVLGISKFEQVSPPPKFNILKKKKN